MAFDNQNKKILSSDQTWDWLKAALKTPVGANLAGSIATAPLGNGFSARIQELGIVSDHRSFGLDLSCVRHIWHDHGGVSDKRRDQVAVSLNDLMAIPAILEHATVELAQERPRSRGKIRIICLSTSGNHEFTVIAEISKRLIVRVPLWKKRP
jgi:hypothetical protein